MSSNINKSESFLPAVGIVMSNAQIDSVDPSDVIIMEENVSVTTPQNQLRVNY